MSEQHPDHRQLSYRDAGVDIEAGAALVERIGAACKATHRPEMLGGLGGFAAMTELPAGYDQPVLVSGTDGVGTKLKLAIDYNRHDHVGQDLVAMCANDVLVTGAEPFQFLDYYATGKLDVDIAARVITGIAKGCELAGCALAGGETAEMPGFYSDGEYDLAGFCVGIVNKPDIVDGQALNIGDVALGLASSGPHSNGYSLIRKILEHTGTAPNVDLLDDLLAPTRIYVKPVLDTLRRHPGAVHGMVHITGGGFTENLPRVLTNPAHGILIDPQSWQWPDIFSWLQQAGNVAHEEMLTTFNCGVGFVLLVDPDQATVVQETLAATGEVCTRIGEVVSADTSPEAGQLVLTG